MLPNITDRAKNYSTFSFIFIYIFLLCIQAYKFFLLRSLKITQGRKTNTISLICRTKILHKWTYLWNRKSIRDIEKSLVVTNRKPGRTGMSWKFGISRYKLICIEWINNKILLFKTRNYIWYPIINYKGK